MQLHLVGGFLGSGKTTAIGSACELLRDRGLRAAVVTNDQGEMLVDTGALAGTAAAVAEVTGGCFCCRYPELVERVAALAADGAEHVFAEAVGSCVDIARTVVNPLLRRREVALQAVTFSVLADARLLAGYLAGRPLPWTNPALDYLFERQLAEAPLLVASRADLVAAEWGGLEGLRDAMRAAMPGRRLLVQDSRTAAGVAAWMRHIDASGTAAPDADSLLAGVEVDYERYGAAEAALAWNDREVELTGVEGRTTDAARAVIERVVAALRDRGGAVGHLKFLVRDHYRDAKGERHRRRPGRRGRGLERPVALAVAGPRRRPGHADRERTRGDGRRCSGPPRRPRGDGGGRGSEPGTLVHRRTRTHPEPLGVPPCLPGAGAPRRATRL